MIKNAKVSLQTVKRFEQSVAAVRDYSSQLDKGMLCFEDFLRILSEQIDVMRESIEIMTEAQNRLAVKIKEIETEIARLTAILNDLLDRLSSLESELSNTPESFTMTNEKGENYEVPNPAYTAIQAQISAVNSEIRTVNAQLTTLQERLNKANTINGQLSSQIDSSNSVIYSLQEKQKSCIQYRAELEEIKTLNIHNGTSVVESLKRIEEIISSYLKIRMNYESASLQEQNIISQRRDVNINININKTIVYDDKAASEPIQKNTLITEEDISKHHILFDAYGRISEYDNKTFGGQYNEYDTRLSKTSADDNPILGHYEGYRGESKYIPSGRSVEGVIVIDILKKYGLDGIEYRNAEPDFEVCSEAVVKIMSMSENRENYIDSYGNSMMGNFTQADIECAKMWSEQKRGGRDDWKGRDIFEYRQANKLTWHEKCDTKTMVLVRSEINSYFRHSGGCSECRMRDGVQDGGEFDE